MVSRMRRTALIMLCMVGMGTKVQAKGWDPPAYKAQFQFTHLPNLFSGLDPRLDGTQLGPRFLDQAYDLNAGTSSARRLGKTAKLSVDLSAHSRLLGKTHSSQYTEFALQPGLRTKTMQYTLEGAWTPKRVVFPPGDDESGAFEDLALTFGARRALGARLRGRLEGALERRNFLTDSLSGRDAQSRSLYALFTASPQQGVDVNFELEWDSDRASDVKYDKDTRFTGLGAIWSWREFRCETGARAVIRHYLDPNPKGSNHARRDQRLELRARVGRPLRPGVNASLGWASASQTSNRVDNPLVVLFGLPYNRSYNFSSSTFTFSLEWAGGGKKP